MSKDYNILSQHIVDKYIEFISGDDLEEIIVSDDPAERVMVGMLAENRIEQNLSGGYVENNDTRFESVPSMTLSFIIKKNYEGILSVVPRGMLFYMIKPDYSKTVEYIISKYSEKDNFSYNNIEELSKLYPNEKFMLPNTYRAIRLEKAMGNGIEIRLDSLSDGKFHLEKEIGNLLAPLSDSVSSEIRIVKTNRIKFADLLDEKSFYQAASISDERAYPRWAIDVYCNVLEENDKYHFTLQLVNKTVTDLGNNTGYLPKVFNAGLYVKGNENIEFEEIRLDYFNNSFKEHTPVYVVAENTSATYDAKNNAVFTVNVPQYIQYRLKTKSDFNEFTGFDQLAENPVFNLMHICNAMDKDYKKCLEEYQKVRFKTETAKEKYKEALDGYKYEINRFNLGIEQIKNRDFVKKAFIYMNETFRMKLGNDARPISGWRLFQIVFIVSMIPEIIRSEYKNDSTLVEADLDVANLLYFPTGGGKTEAFLGACVFDMFFDRLRGKNEGITAFLKYPLRLLAVQQLDRVLTVVMKANALRIQKVGIKNTTPFRVGFYVGKGNTPNRIDSNERLSPRGRVSGAPQDLILESDQDTLNEYYRFIDTCPCCGKKSISIRFNREKWMLEHVCNNEECDVKELPLMIVDNEIYRYLPSLVVSVVDKMALLGITNEYRMLFGQVKGKCPVHGFSYGKKCLCAECKQKNGIQYVARLKDPAPTLFIQDELHLMTESLGAFDSHYESFMDYYTKELLPEEDRKQIRYIGASATISMYKEHVRNLYHMDARRFPCEYPSVIIGEDFYSYIDFDDVTRIILGYAPYGRSITDGMWQSVYVMRLICYRLMQKIDIVHQELVLNGFESDVSTLKEMLFNYWIELVYNNRRDDVVDLANALQNQGNNLLETKGIPKFIIKQMTSEEDFQLVRKTLFDIQANKKNVNSTNLILATKTISHGVDEDSFNVMYFFGMPNNNAEYIQAYSRVGRKYTGIVVDIIRLMRIRDRSYLKNFVIFHQNKDELVESVPINRWAKNAVYSTLPGILSGILIQYYTLITDSEDFYQAYKVKRKLMSGEIDIGDVINKVVEAYGCNEQEKNSLAYKDIIIEEVNHILAGIKNYDFDTKEMLGDAIARFSRGKKKPMRSLRDTEEQIEIEIR